MAKKLLDAAKKELGIKKKSTKTDLFGAMSEKLFGGKPKKEEKSKTDSDPSPTPAPAAEPKMAAMGDDMGIIAKNSMVFPGMSRDINVMRQNMVQQTKALGLKASLGADAQFLKAGERETKLGVEREKEQKKREEKSPAKVSSKPTKTDAKPKKKMNKWLAMLKILSDPDVLILAIYGALKIAEFFQGIWDDIVEGWNEWIVGGKLVDTIVEKAGDLVTWIKNTFTLENLMNFIKNPGDYLIPLWESVKGFFSEVGNFVVDKFNSVLEFFGVPVKRKEAEVPELPDFKQQKVESITVDAPPDSEEAKQQKPKYTKEQIAAAEEAEKKAQYTGQDEIVRERMGLKGPSAAEMRGEVEPQYVRDSQGNVVKDGSGQPVKYGAQPDASKQKAPEGQTKSPERTVAAPNVGGDDKSVMAMIKKHEGFKTRPYKDSLGLWTIGVGHLIGDGKSLPPEWNREFTMSEVDTLFAQDYEHHKKLAEKAPGYNLANEKGRAALIDLTFNMGGGWYKTFKNAAAALSAGDFQKAADELTNSAWYKQVKGRAQTVVALIREGLGKPGQPTAAQAPKPTTTAAGPSQQPQPGANGKAPAIAAVTTKADSGVDISNFNKSLEERVAFMASSFQQQTGKKLSVTSGYRSNEKQKELWDAKVAQLGGNEAAARKVVAEPAPPLGKGRGSQHMQGGAIDINSKGDSGINVLAGPRDKPTGWLEKFGLTRPVPGEDWHIQLSGAAATADNPVNPGQPVLVADKSGKASEVNSGKSQPIPETPKPKATGAAVASASTQVGAEQRNQVACACQPVIINNTVTASSNQTIVQKKEESKPTVSWMDKLTGRVA